MDSGSVVNVLSETDKACVGVVYRRSAVVTEHTVDGMPATDS